MMIFFECGYSSTLSMMLFLIANIVYSLSKLLTSQRKDPIPSLPAKIGHRRIHSMIQMMSTAPLDAFDKIGDRELRRDRDHKMNMILNTANCVSNAFQSIRLANDITV